MPFPFDKVHYEALNAKRQESYNFQKASGVLADYGFVTIRLSDDWEGADFLAHHISGETLRVQLKGRATFAKKYKGKDIWICFRDGSQWYVYPHDEILDRVLAETNVANTDSWKKPDGMYSFPSISQQLANILAPYRLSP